MVSEAMINAVKNNDYNELNKLLQSCGENFNIDEGFITDFVTFTETHGMYGTEEYQKTEPVADTLYTLALNQRNYKIVELILLHGANPNISNVSIPNHTAAFIINKTCDILDEDSKNNQSLKNLQNILIRFGAPKKSENEYHTNENALNQAIASNDREAVRVLIMRQNSIIEPKNYEALARMDLSNICLKGDLSRLYKTEDNIKNLKKALISAKVNIVDACFSYDDLTETFQKEAKLPNVTVFEKYIASKCPLSQWSYQTNETALDELKLFAQKATSLKFPIEYLNAIKNWVSKKEQNIEENKKRHSEMAAYSSKQNKTKKQERKAQISQSNNKHSSSNQFFKKAKIDNNAHQPRSTIHTPDQKDSLQSSKLNSTSSSRKR